MWIFSRAYLVDDNVQQAFNFMTTVWADLRHG